MKKSLWISCATSLLIPPWLLAEPTFQKDVYPLVKESCISCHGPKKQLGRFRADRREDYLKDTDNGPWVVPGDSSASRLVAMLAGDIKTKKSPEKHVFPAEKISLIRVWIDSGAK
jgi:hypothetical protein